jgi:hypothetical protein
MPQMANPDTIGPEFHTADQAQLRESLGRGFDGGRTQSADPAKAQRRYNDTPGAPADANVNRITVDPTTRVADSVRLEATSDGWIDTGGKTPRDMKVVNW